MAESKACNQALDSAASLYLKYRGIVFVTKAKLSTGILTFIVMRIRFLKFQATPLIILWHCYRQCSKISLELRVNHYYQAKQMFPFKFRNIFYHSLSS